MAKVREEKKKGGRRQKATRRKLRGGACDRRTKKEIVMQKKIVQSRTRRKKNTVHPQRTTEPARALFLAARHRCRNMDGDTQEAWSREARILSCREDVPVVNTPELFGGQYNKRRRGLCCGVVPSLSCQKHEQRSSGKHHEHDRLHPDAQPWPQTHTHIPLSPTDVDTPATPSLH